MRFRRLFALLTSAAMLHLTVVAGDAACATHESDAAPGASASDAAAPSHEMSMGGHVMSSPAAAPGSTVSDGPAAKSGTPPCEIPTQQHCCDALVGCSVDGVVTHAHDGLGTNEPSSARILVALHDAPASFASAPEPPPPKA
jgi:hypothetical protein